jgi:DnaD/phage-associated family protein
LSKLLLDDKPIVVIPSLAEKIGLNEAIILQQMNYWLQKSKHEYEGKHWVYNTYEEWQEQFPFWSKSTIVRCITKLEKLGYLTTGNFNKSPIDKTKWYTINFEILEGMSSPSSQNESSSTQIESSSSQNESSIYSDCIDELVNLNRTIPESTTESTSDIKNIVEEEAHMESPFQFFEQNGFGTIGGYISQKIIQWCEDLSDELVLEAMKLAVEQGKKTWRYVEAILRSWAEKKITTVDQAHALQMEHKEKKSQQSSTKSRSRPIRSEQLPDWFEDRDPQNTHQIKENEETPEEKRERLLKIQEKYKKGNTT